MGEVSKLGMKPLSQTRARDPRWLPISLQAVGARERRFDRERRKVAPDRTQRARDLCGGAVPGQDDRAARTEGLFHGVRMTRNTLDQIRTLDEELRPSVTRIHRLDPAVSPPPSGYHPPWHSTARRPWPVLQTPALRLIRPLAR